MSERYEQMSVEETERRITVTLPAVVQDPDGRDGWDPDEGRSYHTGRLDVAVEIEVVFYGDGTHEAAVQGVYAMGFAGSVVGHGAKPIMSVDDFCSDPGSEEPLRHAVEVARRQLEQAAAKEVAA